MAQPDQPNPELSQPPGAPGTPRKLCTKLSLPAWVVDEASAGLGGSTRTQFGQEVVLRMEVVTNTQCKVLALLSLLGAGATCAAIIVMAIVKANKDAIRVLVSYNTRYFTACLALSAIMLCPLLFVLAHFAWRLAEARRSGRLWTHRRRRITLLAFAQLLVQTLNTCFWLAIVAYETSTNCAWGDVAVALLGWGQWTLWNTLFLLIIIQGHGGNVWRGGRFINTPSFIYKWRRRGEKNTESGMAADDDCGPEKLILDAPMSVHTAKLLPWVGLEVVVCLLASHLHRRMVDRLSGVDCSEVEELNLTCRPDEKTQTYIGLLVGFVLLYLVLYIVHMVGTFRQLAGRPYQHARVSNILFRIQARQVAVVFVAMVLGLAVLLLVDISSCWSFIFAWYGLIPCQVAATTMCLFTSWLFMPSNPRHPNQILQAWLQEFAWSSASLPGALEARNHHLASSEELRRAPMFCVETAMKLLHWSCLVYDWLPEDPGPWDMEFALGALGLEGWEEVWDPAVDMRVLIGWGRGNGGPDGGGGRLVLAFRGTASFENVVTDLKLWQMVHPPRRKAPVVTAWGLAQMRRVLRVHAGFYGAWAAAPLVKQATEQVRRSGVSEAVLVERGAGAHTRGPGAVAAAAAAGAVHTGAAEHGAAGLGVEGVNGQQAQQAQQHVDGDASSRGKEPGVASGAAGGEGETGLPSAKSSQRGKRPSKASRIRGLPFNRQLMTRLEAVCEERGIDPDRAEFLLTGHSLGGATATLAALDLRLCHPTARFTVYTFGQPRVGNRPFATEYDALLPEHWAVVCDQDPVPRVPKGTYKRCGQRVIINAGGDLIIRPTFLESSVLEQAGSVGDHLLEAYRASFASLLKAQFTPKQLPEGEEGVSELCGQVDLDRLLLCQGLDLASLRDPACQPVTREQLDRRQRAKERSLGLRIPSSFIKRTTSRAGNLCGSCTNPVLQAGAQVEGVAEEWVTPKAGAAGAATASAEAEAEAEAEVGQARVAAGVGGVLGRAAAAIRAQSLRRGGRAGAARFDMEALAEEGELG